MRAKILPEGNASQNYHNDVCLKRKSMVVISETDSDIIPKSGQKTDAFVNRLPVVSCRKMVK